jgi:hypothetical protein
MGLLFVLALVAVAAWIVLSKVGKATASTPIPFIQLALDDIRERNYREPTWADDKLAVTLLVSSVSPLAVSSLDMETTKAWLAGKGTLKDILTFAHRAEAAGLSFEQQVDATYDFTRALMNVEAGIGSDGVKSARLLVCHALKNLDWMERATSRWIDLADFQALFPNHTPTAREIESGDVSMSLSTVFRGNEVAVVVSKKALDDEIMVRWKPDMRPMQNRLAAIKARRDQSEGVTNQS